MRKTNLKLLMVLMLIGVVVLIFPNLSLGAIETPIGTEITMYVADMHDVIPGDDFIDPRIINGGYWDYFPSDQASGTGVFNTYLAVQNKGDERGYNTGGKAKPYDVDDAKTSALPLSAVPLVQLPDGNWYREFAADINQISQIPKQYVSLEVLQIWQTESDHIMNDGYNYDLVAFTMDDNEAKLIYDLDGGYTGGEWTDADDLIVPEVNVTLVMDYGVNTGSGKPDYKVFVPAEWFTDQEYVVMGVVHGNFNAANSGFEEWGVRIIDQAVKAGTKFHDRNADGIWDPGEEGLGGWTIYVDYNDNGLLDTGEPSAVTASDGTYTINGITPGIWKVKEVAQSQWYQSYPAIGYHEHEFAGGMTYLDNNFGNYQNATKSGYKWHDLNADGLWNGEELGLPDWTIEAVQGVVVVDTATTDADGYYEFSLPPGEYTFREVLPAEWIQSYPAAPGTYTETLESQGVYPNNNFGNYQNATKSGYKFHDLNADGVWQQPAELGLPDWTIYVDYNDNDVLDGEEPSAVTASDGSYTITGIVPGTWKVKEEAQTGWTQSYPVGGFHEEIFISGIDFTENNFGNWTMATKSGYKWHDLNADGLWNGDELGLPDWTIEAVQGVVVVDTATTDADGYYEFSLPPGEYTFREVLPADWVQSYPAAPGTYTETLESQGVYPNNNFGNYQNATKSGYKWHDLNADGLWNGDELGLPDWTIEAVQGVVVVDTATTDADGYYEFSLPPGEYTFREVLPADWFQSYPAAPGTYTETLESQGVYPNNNFGNYQNATKSGYKWHDLNADGLWNGDELGLPDWTIEAVQGVVVVDTATTDADGYYEFSLPPGEYTFREVLPADWFQSYPAAPGTYTETLESQGVYPNNNFGNYQNATKSGYKWHDLNADGLWNGDELGLPDWTIEAVQGVVVVDTATTDADGYYEFSLPPGEYTFREVLPADWFQSYPAAPGTYTETLESQGVYPNNNFGNYQNATKSGYKWHDLNADGLWNGDELGLPDWTIEAVQGVVVVDTATTDADGYYEFSLPPGEYTFREVLPADWFQSYPAAPGTYTETLESQGVYPNNNFGNYQNATKSGYKWHDLNADGLWNGDELGLPDWTIEAVQGVVVVDTATTDADGYYEFSLPPGEYTFREVLPADWFQSYPAAPAILNIHQR